MNETPQDSISEIIPKLIYLSGYTQARKTYLDEYKISRVISIGNKYELNSLYHNIEGIDYLQLECDDSEQANIQKYFIPVINWINKDAGKPVLIHCRMGISRSVTLVIAYMMKQLKAGTYLCLDTIRKTRPIADPNLGFITQLNNFYFSANLK